MCACVLGARNDDHSCCTRAPTSPTRGLCCLTLVNIVVVKTRSQAMHSGAGSKLAVMIMLEMTRTQACTGLHRPAHMKFQDAMIRLTVQTVLGLVGL